jgi:hypothetical protein
LFASDQPPLPPSQDIFRQVNIDTWTGLIAGDACKEFVKDDLVMNVQDKWGREWLRSGTGRDWLEAHDLPRNPFFAPERECNASDPRPVIEFSNLNNGTVVTDLNLPINGVVDVKNGGLIGWRLRVYFSAPDHGIPGRGNQYLSDSYFDPHVEFGGRHRHTGNPAPPALQWRGKVRGA